MMAAGFNLVGVRRVLELEHENRRLQAQIDAREDGTIPPLLTMEALHT